MDHLVTWMCQLSQFCVVGQTATESRAETWRETQVKSVRWWARTSSRRPAPKRWLCWLWWRRRDTTWCRRTDRGSTEARRQVSVLRPWCIVSCSPIKLWYEYIQFGKRFILLVMNKFSLLSNSDQKCVKNASQFDFSQRRAFSTLMLTDFGGFLDLCWDKTRHLKTLITQLTVCRLMSGCSNKAWGCLCCRLGGSGSSAGLRGVRGEDSQRHVRRRAGASVRESRQDLRVQTDDGVQRREPRLRLRHVHQQVTAGTRTVSPLFSTYNQYVNT